MPRATTGRCADLIFNYDYASRGGGGVGKEQLGQEATRVKNGHQNKQVSITELASLIVGHWMRL